MAAPLVQFVSSPDTGASVRFDFHAEGRFTNPAEWVFEPGAFLGSPGGVGAEYDYQRISFTLYLGQDRHDALAAQSALARELMRDENYLLFRLPGAHDAPLWFHTYRATPGQLGRLEWVRPEGSSSDVWAISVTLVADHTAMGELVSHEVTIANNPTAENGMAVVLPEIKGDAPAPLNVRAAPSFFYVKPLVNVTALDVPWPGTQFWQAEDLTLGTDAAALSGDPSWSGGGAVGVDFATDETLAVRLSAGVAPPLAGQYRVFMRASSTGGGGVSYFTIQGGGVACVKSVTSEHNSTQPSSLFDLGLYAFPKGNLPPAGSSYTIAPRANEVEVLISRTVSTGAQSMRLDHLLLVPVDLVDARSSVTADLPVSPFESADFGAELLIDSDHEAVRWLEDGKYTQATAQTPRGGYPYVTPGAVNVLHFLKRSHVSPFSGAEDIYDTSALTLTYHPRYLYLAGN